MEARMPLHVLEHVCTPIGTACTLTLVAMMSTVSPISRQGTCRHVLGMCAQRARAGRGMAHASKENIRAQRAV